MLVWLTNTNSDVSFPVESLDFWQYFSKWVHIWLLWDPSKDTGGFLQL